MQVEKHKWHALLLWDYLFCIFANVILLLLKARPSSECMRGIEREVEREREANRHREKMSETLKE